MTEVIPTRAYDLLEIDERLAVDDYVAFAVKEQRKKRERIINALKLPIPNEYIIRSRNALYRPLLLAAVSERIREIASEEDISADRVVREISCIALADLNDYIDSGNFGEFKIKTLEDIPREVRGAVKSIETKPGSYGLHSKIVLHDKIPALKMLSELVGLTTPDAPPALRDYARPPVNLTDRQDETEELYMELIEA